MKTPKDCGWLTMHSHAKRGAKISSKNAAIHPPLTEDNQTRKNVI